MCRGRGDKLHAESHESRPPPYTIVDRCYGLYDARNGGTAESGRRLGSTKSKSRHRRISRPTKKFLPRPMRYFSSAFFFNDGLVPRIYARTGFLGKHVTLHVTLCLLAHPLLGNLGCRARTHRIFSIEVNCATWQSALSVLVQNAPNNPPPPSLAI